MAIGLVPSWVAAQSPVSFAILSTSGTRQICTEKAEQCVIPVFVKAMTTPAGPGCEARVDMRKVHVKGRNTLVIWKIFRDDDTATDKNVYAFEGQGVQWVDSNGTPTAKADSDARKHFDHGTTQGAMSRWEGKNVQPGDGDDHNYKPTVVIVSSSSPPTRCAAGDPRIANDGG